MNLVTLENVSKQYSERLLLDEVDLMINEGERLGLIGVNGSGKTTLLRIVAGLEPADSGRVTVWGGVTVEYLPQQPALDESLTVLDHLFQSDSPQMQLLHAYQQTNHQLQQQPDDPALQQQLIELSAQMDRHHGWEAEANAKTILTRLGVGDFGAPIHTLSGGQRKRVALAHALIDPADLLILDEPTNHIDADAVAWLEEYLLTVPSSLLMVTHDRYFLDRVVNRIVELDRRKLVNYPGNYSRYLELHTERHEQLAAAEEERKKRLKQELEWLRRAPKARGTKQKARKQRIEEMQQLRYDRREQQVAMALAGRRLGKKVLQVEGLSKGFDRPLFQDLDFRLEPGDRIGIIGPNGAGKSTFLDILAGKVAPDSGSVNWGETVQLGYYDQESDELPEEKRIIEFINGEAPLIYTDEGERVEAARMLEWFLFTRAEQRTYIKDLSGGERRRLYLLRTLVHRPNVLLLDEPTNDLDIQTLTVLEEFMDHFQGALVVVSHDRYFLDRTVDYLVHFEDGQVSGRYPAPYSSYRHLRQEQEAQRKRDALAANDGHEKHAAATSRASTRVEASKAATPRRLSWQERRELETLEGQVAELEREKAELAEQINASGDDYLLLQELAEELQAVEGRLEERMLRWLELSEIGENE